MGTFHSRLRERNPDPTGRRWLFVSYDQLGDAVGPLADEEPAELGIVLIENPWKAGRRPYHKQKLALVLANLRHFALEQAERGVAVRHCTTDGPYAAALRELAAELGPLRIREPAERELRVDLHGLESAGALEVLPHGGWLTTETQFRDSQVDGPPWRMDTFYRHVRRDTGILMEDGSPAGGKYSYDAENRETWAGEPPAPDPPTFQVDPVTAEAVELVESRFGDHPGRLRPDRLPATATDAERLWAWARGACLPHFGPYEDAMSVHSSGLFHTRISPLLNLGRLDARSVLEDVLALELPLASKEGFVRQLLGWREFVRHVHRETDGLRSLPGSGESDGRDPFEGADPSFLGAREPLPEAYWGAPSGLACLDRVVKDVIDEGWSHHITRLMVLTNIASLLDVRPREITDWFWAMYIDAFDWVVEPNVLAMGTFGVGDLMTTKPYISGSNYLDRMSDYCAECRFDPKSDCPLRRLYWAYLARHAESLSGNRRLALPLASSRKRKPEERKLDGRTYEWTRARLAGGGELDPEDSPERDTDS